LGHKVHPTGFRLGFIKDWQSKWYSDAHYAEFVLEDYKLREEIRRKYSEAAISLIEIDRQAKDVTITLHTARPGIVIGRGGQRVDEMRQHLEALVGKRIRLNIQEVRQPEMDAYLVARSVADQIERRISHRRAIKQTISRAMQRGALGIKIKVSGRLGGADMSRKDQGMEGRVPLHTLKADIDYGTAEAHTTLGLIGVKVWLYKGDRILEQPASIERRRPKREAGKAAPTDEAAAPAPAAGPATPAEPAQPEAAEEGSAPQSEPEAEAKPDAAT